MFWLIKCVQGLWSMHRLCRQNPPGFKRVNQSDFQYMMDPADCRSKIVRFGSDKDQVIRGIGHVMNLAIANISMSQKNFT